MTVEELAENLRRQGSTVSYYKPVPIAWRRRHSTVYRLICLQVAALLVFLIIVLVGSL